MEANDQNNVEQNDPGIEEGDEPEAEAVQVEVQDESDSVDREELQDEIADLREELEDKEKKIEEYKGKLQRLKADFENYKKRQISERQEQISGAKDDVILQVVPIYDNFVRAFRSFHKNDDMESFLEGVEKIYAQFDEVLQKMNVEPIDAEGEQFDPERHEALMRVELEEYEHNEVIEEFERGYYRDERVIKPSKVKVNILPEDKREHDSEQNNDGDQ